jgi:type IV pilus assembly protein PilA
VNAHDTLNGMALRAQKGQQMRKVVIQKQRGFTLVELMIVVAIVGVLAVLAIYGVRKYIANSKTTEARNSLGEIKNDQASAFERESGGTTVLAPGGTTSFIRTLCPNGAPVPGVIGTVSALKYQSQKSDWADGVGLGGWQCLKFSLEQPQYFMYTFTGGTTSSAYVAMANGDLNGDGTPSTFTISGSVQSGILNTSPTIGETNPEE